MYYDFLVKIHEEKGTIFERTIKGVTYINYEYDRVYLNFQQKLPLNPKSMLKTGSK